MIEQHYGYVFKLVTKLNPGIGNVCFVPAYVTHSAKKDIMLQNFKIEFYI